MSDPLTAAAGAIGAIASAPAAYAAAVTADTEAARLLQERRLQGATHRARRAQRRMVRRILRQWARAMREGREYDAAGLLASLARHGVEPEEVTEVADDLADALEAVQDMLDGR